jgi:hypothetical protein
MARLTALETINRLRNHDRLPKRTEYTALTDLIDRVDGLYSALTPFLRNYIEDPSIQEVLSESLDQVDAILRDTDELIKDYNRGQ